MQAGNFLTSLAKKLGLENNQALVNLLTNATFAQTEIADELANSIDTGLMSLEGAKNNQDVLNHFKALNLNPIDTPIIAWAKEHGLEAEYTAEKSTYKRLAMMIEKSKALIEAAKKTGGAGEKDAEVKRLTEQLQKLQGEMTAAIAGKDTEISNLKAAHATDILDMLVTSTLAGKQYANDKINHDANVQYARFILNAALKEKGAVIVNDNGTLKLKQAAAPELDYLDEGHKPVTFGSFSDQTLAAAGVLKAFEPTQQRTPPTEIRVPGGDTRDFSNYDAAMQAAIGALK